MATALEFLKLYIMEQKKLILDDLDDVAQSCIDFLCVKEKCIEAPKEYRIKNQR